MGMPGVEREARHAQGVRPAPPQKRTWPAGTPRLAAYSWPNSCMPFSVRAGGEDATSVEATPSNRPPLPGATSYPELARTSCEPPARLHSRMATNSSAQPVPLWLPEVHFMRLTVWPMQQSVLLAFAMAVSSFCNFSHLPGTPPLFARHAVHSFFLASMLAMGRSGSGRQRTEGNSKARAAAGPGGLRQ